MAANEVGRVSIGIEADTRRFDAQMRRIAQGGGNRGSGGASGSGGGAINQALTRGLKIGVIIGGLKLIGDSIGSITRKAMEFEAATQQVDRIFGESSSTVKTWARNNAIAFNMSTNEAIKFSSVYGNLISGITTSQSENANLTQELLRQSAVVASGTGRTMVDVMDRIRSGLLGNTEAIEDLGINVNVGMLQATYAFKRFAGDKSWNQLDFQTQQQIRLMAILEQSTKKYGSEVNQNTSSSLARLSALISNISLNIGQTLKPVIDGIINSMIILATSIERVTGSFAKMVNRLTGTKEQTKAMADTSKEAAQGQTELGKAMSGAGKEAKKGVAGFDEVNQLQEQMSSGGVGSSGIAGAVENIDNKPLEKTNDELSEFEKKIKSLMEEMSPTFEKLNLAFLSLGDALTDMWNSQAFIELRKLLAKQLKFAFTRSLELLTGAIETLAGSITIITGLLNGDWAKAFEGAEQVVQGLWDILESTAISVFGEKAKVNLDIFEEKWKKTWENAKTEFNSWDENTQKAFELTFSNLFMKMVKWNVILLKTWKDLYDNLTEKLGQWKEEISPKLDEAKNRIVEKFNEIKVKTSEKWELIKETILNTIMDSKTKIKTLWDKITTSLVQSWENIKISASQQWTSIVNVIIGFIRKIQQAWNDLEFKLPEKKFNIAGKEFTFGGIGFETPDVKLTEFLPTGGSIPVIQTQSQTSQGSGLGTEQTLNKIGEALENALQSNRETSISLDGKKLGRALIPILNNENNRRGTTTLVTTR